MKNLTIGQLAKETGTHVETIRYYERQRLVVEAAVQFPVLQDLNGDALKNDFTGILSLRERPKITLQYIVPIVSLQYLCVYLRNSHDN